MAPCNNSAIGTSKPKEMKRWQKGTWYADRFGPKTAYTRIGKTPFAMAPGPGRFFSIGVGEGLAQRTSLDPGRDGR